MASVVVSLVLALVLLGSAALKLTDGAGTRAALGTYGIRDPLLARVVWGGLVGVELVLAALVAAGVEPAMWAGAVLFAGFAGAQSAVLVSGGGGAPCACFGARGRVGRASVARAGGPAVVFAALPLVDRRSLSTEEWLGIGLGAALLGLVAVAVAVLALAREVAALRGAVDPRGALEIPEEGPELGGRSDLMEVEPGRLGLAVFTSEGCALCRALEPAVQALGRDPLVRLQTFDELRDAHAWEAEGIPGSPFAVALDDDGTVLAKGTFNTAGQLESVLAAAERRRA
jgi:hypothetical protein